eukprot:CAMPEP_0172384386 /NCGR_PEP_ID=MMETSP1061-20121228/2166_1 /TAXON_ID=37318 /ORGANISM="Pseudo-nitzschia pungens, Strain cf. pungens" /LENGTH=56 /DNA_ID=CAMNT_0013112995 /DNA_START=236 /DNA_END=402 /DNA_ORIENTATION=+
MTMQCGIRAAAVTPRAAERHVTSRHVTGRRIIEPNRTAEPSHKIPDTRSDPSVPDS